MEQESIEMTDEVFEYFKERYSKWRFKVSNYPDFKTKEEVDGFFTAVESSFRVCNEKKEAAE